MDILESTGGVEVIHGSGSFQYENGEIEIF